LRGEAIQRLAGSQSQGACEWNAVWDYANFRMLDLSDPFAGEESWIPLARPSDTEAGSSHRRAHQAFEHAVLMYDRGDYESAHRMIRMVIDHGDLLQAQDFRNCHLFLAWIQARRGFTDGVAWLDLIFRGVSETLSMIGDYLIIYRFQGLVPGPPFRQWCDKGLQLLSASPCHAPKDIVAVRCSHAYDLLCRGRADEAWTAYQDGVPPDWLPLLHQRFAARILVEKAETLRRLGRTDETLALLEEAQSIQTHGSYSGDIADLTLTVRAKTVAVRGDVPEAWRILQEAARIQRSSANVSGEMRTLLLLARLHSPAVPDQVDFRPDDLRERIVQIWRSRTALLECPLARGILADWPRWVAGECAQGESGGDLFWGL
jgi:hypothetical protein